MTHGGARIAVRRGRSRRRRSGFARAASALSLLVALGGCASGTERETIVLHGSFGNRTGIVSDIDDTVLVTEVSDSFRMFGNTFLKNPLQREAVPGMAALYERVLAANPRPDDAPMFYLSSSLRELHDYLTAFLATNEFPRGVLLTRRLTFDRQGYRLLDAVRYKSDRLVEILERLPDVRFVLIGDDGEHDPEVYDAVRRRFPERIVGIWIRRTGIIDAPLPDGQRDLAEVLATGPTATGVSP